MADGLHTSGSLTDKDLQQMQQTSSTASELGLMDCQGFSNSHGHSLGHSSRDMISELRHLLNASGIHELRDWMAAVQESMLNMEMVVAAQSSKMGEMVSVFESLATQPNAVQKPASSEPAKPERPPEDPISLPFALPNSSNSPRPRQVSPALSHFEGPKSSHSSRPNVSAESDPISRRSSKQSRKSGGRRSSGASDTWFGKFKVPMTMGDLEEHRASQLLRSMNKKESVYKSLRRGHSSHEVPSRSASQKSVRPQHAASVQQLQPQPPQAVEQIPSGKKKAFTMNSRLGGEDKAAILEKCQRVSLEELRTNYDAIISEVNTTKTSRNNLDDDEVSALPRFGRCLLCIAGHLRFNRGLASQCFAVLSYGISPAAVCGVLLYGGLVSSMDTGLLLTLICFHLGISAASFSFQQKGVALLLGPEENRLDDYAVEADFMMDWQKLSRRRLIETGCMYLVMACIRFGSYVWVRGGFDFHNDVWDTFYGVAFWFMLFRYLLLCYSILHCCCGLELALDSFGVRFFKEMDIEEALGEWNTLQATLRQVSTKISDALLVIGFCCLASMVLLGEQVITNPQEFVNTPGRMTSWLSRYYPLMIIFVYTMMRAAAVTEKANRVPPLVNSWKFHHSHEDAESEGLWMDQERQYAVQYISQSRAGFFIKGSQLTVPTVQKLLYYVGAVSFALFSRLSAV